MAKVDVFTDYVSWKFENYTLIGDLIKKKSNCISRFTHIIAICDFLYDKYINNSHKLSEDEKLIFETGFNYLFNRFESIDGILKQNFKNDVVKMNEFGKTVNLILYIDDFIDDLNNYDHTDEYIKTLDLLSQKSYSYLNENNDAPDTFFALVDDKVIEIYDNLKIEYYGVNDIMYDVAVTYNLEVEPENEINIFQDFMKAKEVNND